MPLIIFDNGVPDDMLKEFDVCSLCGQATSLLIWVRLHVTLVSLCGLCCDELKVGYDAMLSKRMQFDLSASRDEA